MKKIVGLIVGIMGAVLLCGCSIKESFTYDNEEQYHVGSAQIKENVENLDINWAAGSVTVKTADVSEVRIEEDAPEDLEEKQQMHWWLDGTTLRIKIYGAGKLLSIGIEKHLTVTLPENLQLKDVEIDVASAEVLVENLTAEEVDVDSASGSVQVIGNAKEVNIDTASGDIYLDGMAEELELNTASGKIEVNENGKLKRANIGTASGDVKVAAKTFDDMDIDTASGKVTLQLPADSNFTLDMDTASGDFRSDLALKMDGKKYVCGNGKGMIKIDTASGDIFLKEN